MDTPQEQPDPRDANPSQTDPQLDALLDEALGTPAIPPSSDLAQRIIDRTQPMLGRPSVLARIGPRVLRIAAAVAIVVGAGVVATVMTRNPTPPVPPVSPALPIDTGYAIEQLGAELQAINRAIEPGNTRIDEQLDMLALRVELVSIEDAWSAAGSDTNSLIDQAVMGFEIDQLSDDTAFIWADGTTLF